MPFHIRLRLPTTVLAVAAATLPVFHGHGAISVAAMIQVSDDDGPNNASDDPPGPDAVEATKASEVKVPESGGNGEPGNLPATHSEGKRQAEQWGGGLGGAVLRDLPPAEELRSSLAEKYDLSELGGESPHVVARAVLEGILGGDVEKVITAHDLTTKGDIVTSLSRAAQAEMTRRYLQMYATIKHKFGNEGLQAMTDLSQGHPQARELQSRWQKDNLTVGEVTDSAVNKVLDAMDMHYNEDGQKVVARPRIKELAGLVLLVPKEHLFLELEMHQRDGRWYAGAEDPTTWSVVYQMSTSRGLHALAKLIDAAEKAETVEQFRQELEELTEGSTVDNDADQDAAGEASGAGAKPDGESSSVDTEGTSSSGVID